MYTVHHDHATNHMQCTQDGSIHPYHVTYSKIATQWEMMGSVGLHNAPLGILAVNSVEDIMKSDVIGNKSVDA